MFNLTKEERQVFLFLFTIVLIGLGINFFLKAHTSPQLMEEFYKDFGKIDLNKADKTVLMSVKGIGEKLAGRIIDYRNAQNGFDELNQLKDVKGITERRYEKFKESFYIE